MLAIGIIGGILVTLLVMNMYMSHGIKEERFKDYFIKSRFRQDFEKNLEKELRQISKKDRSSSENFEALERRLEALENKLSGLYLKLGK